MMKGGKEKGKKKMLSNSTEKVYPGLMSAAHLECQLLLLSAGVASPRVDKTSSRSGLQVLIISH